MGGRKKKEVTDRHGHGGGISDTRWKRVRIHTALKPERVEWRRYVSNQTRGTWWLGKIPLSSIRS